MQIRQVLLVDIDVGSGWRPRLQNFPVHKLRTLFNTFAWVPPELNHFHFQQNDDDDNRLALVLSLQVH
jgi:hypothetical protein